jgi:catechol 2,3-dioxygenase-like lactoylglutathione lyase family enzyme
MSLLNHVAIEMPRALTDETVAFYELLGFSRVDPPESLLDVAAWVRDGEQTVHLLYVEDPVVPPRGHLAVVRPDYEATIARLQAAGHPFRHHEVHWGSPRGYATDPVGHTVEIMEFPPPLPPL